MREHSGYVAGSPRKHHLGRTIPVLLVQRAPAVQALAHLGLSGPVEDARTAQTDDHVLSGAGFLRSVPPYSSLHPTID
eukprot:scaffold82089_cov73-Phaeocystis_antarctica.AAC.1